MQITGIITHALEPRTGVSKAGKQWFSQDFRIEEQGNRFNQSMLFSVFGEDKVRQFNMKVGDVVTVEFDIDAHEYQGRYYNSVTAFNVIHQQQTAPSQQVTAPQSQPAPQPQRTVQNSFFPQPEQDSDLPF